MPNTAVQRSVKGGLWGLGLVALCGTQLAPLTYARAFAPGGSVSTVQAHGVEISLRVAPGPYFVGEALHVQTWLINRSPIIRWVVQSSNEGEGTRINGTAPLMIRARGEASPRFDGPPALCCPPIPSSLSVGERLVADYLIVLGVEGQVDITTHTTFAPRGPNAAGFRFGATISLFSRWPKVIITVSPRVPPHRTLHLQRTHTGVHVIVPSGAHPTIYYGDLLHCGPDAQGQQSYFPTTSGWGPLGNTSITEPECALDGPRAWQIAILAPGYVGATGTY